MKLNPLEITGTYHICPFFMEDNRGSFTKIISCVDEIEELKFSESYYSISNKNVIRGLHFQKRPYDHYKLVTLLSGEIIDVVLDLRKSSTSYLKHIKFHLNKKGESILIPSGCAHGFLSLQNETTLLYNVSTVYNQMADSGIRYDSAGINWGIQSPIISQRDLSLPKLNEIGELFI